MSISRKRGLLFALILIAAIVNLLRVYFFDAKPRPLPPLISSETRRIILSEREMYRLDSLIVAMRSESNILICANKSNEVTAIEMNTVTGLKEANKALSRFLQEGVAHWRSRPYWAISGGGDQLIASCYSNGVEMLGEFDLHLNLTASLTVLPDQGRSHNLYWIPGSDHWMALTFRSNAFEGLLGGGGVPPKPLFMPHGIPDGMWFSVCGLNAATNMMLLKVDRLNAEASNKAEIITLITANATPVMVTNKINLPFKSSPRFVKVSPSGKSLLWDLEEPGTSERTVVTSSRFPFIGVRHSITTGRSSLWISQSDGSQFKCLGEGSPTSSLGIQWCPGGKTIVVQVGWILYFIPVPPEFEKSVEVGNTNSGMAPVSR